MKKDILSKKEQLFLYLVGTFHSSARIALGKTENPMTKSTDINIDQATFYVDLLDLIQEKTKENLSDYEEQMLINTISELKLDLIQEKNFEEAASISEKYEKLFNILLENSPGPSKYLLAKIKMLENNLRLPLVRIPEKLEKEIDEIYSNT